MSNINGSLQIGQEQKRSSCIKIRFVQMALLFTLLMMTFALRSSFSVAIVAMTSNNTSINPEVPYYQWTNINIILSSFYWSYAVLQFFAGKILHYYGIKKVLFVATFFDAIAFILIPVAAEYSGSDGVMALRVIEGLCQGFLLPCINGILGKWLPPHELSFYSSIIFAGTYIGMIASMVITGYISASVWGWPASFYLFGVLEIVWSGLWLIFSADSPATHSSISMEERKYIEHSLGHQDDHLIDKKSIPWGAIFRSLPFWAIIVAAIGESWTSTFISSELPNYLSNALGLNIKNSSLFSAAPIIGCLVCSFFYGPIAGYTIGKGWVSTANSRRMFHGFALFSLTIGLLWVPYIDNLTSIAIVLIISTSASSAVTCGHLVNHMDISPRYADALVGVSNGVGQLIAILAPVLVHFMVADETEKLLWKYSFIAAALIGAGTALFFIIFSSGERQWWDDVDVKKARAASADGETNKGFQIDTFM